MKMGSVSFSRLYFLRLLTKESKKKKFSNTQLDGYDKSEAIFKKLIIRGFELKTINFK